MANQPRVSIRLGLDGKSEVTQGFAEIGDAGTAQAKRYQAAWERASADAETAIEKQAKAAQRLAAAGVINPTTGAGYDQTAKSAAASAAIFTKELERQETEAKRLIASIDPLFAAQMRYAENVQRINAVKATGQLNEERYQQLLASEETALNQAAVASQRFAGASGSTRLGMQQLSFQISDITQQLALGYIPLSRIFIQQSGQVIQAVQLMGGQANKFTQFLGGPWGIALATASVAIVPLIAKLFETGDATEELVKKLKDEARQNALNDQAHAAFAVTLDGVTQALRKNADALKGLSDAGRSAAEQALDQARAQETLAEINKFAAESELRYAKALIERKRASLIGPETKGRPSPDIVAFDQQAQDLQKQLDELGDPKAWDDAIAEAKRQIAEAESRVAVERGLEGEADRIKRLYDDPKDGIIEKTRERLLNEKATTAEIERQTRALKDQRDAQVKAAEDRDRTHTQSSIEHSGGDTVQRAQIEAFLDTAMKYRGLSETRDKGVLEQFFREANLQLDPEKTAWCAAFVNAVLATGGVKGTGSLAARSFLGFGKDDMSSPQKGDVVVVSKSGQDHVGFLQNIDAKGNVEVFGGNTADKVGSSRYSASQVLGIRRPPTPGERYAADLKEAEDASAQAVRDYIKSLADRAKIELKAASAPLAERGKAIEQIDKLNDQHDATMEGLKAELALAGESNAKRTEALRLVQMEYALRRQFPGMTQAEIDKLVAQTAAEDQLREKIAQVEQSLDDARRVGDQLVEDVFNPDNWKTWGDLGKAVLHDIEEAMLRLAVINPLKNMLFGEHNSTLGSILQGLFKIGSDVAGASSGGSGIEFTGGAGYTGSAYDIPPGNAVGDAYFPGGMTWVGEFGKELVRLPKGSRITPAGESRRLAAANDAGIGLISMPISIDATGADAAAVARLNAKLDELKAELPARVIAAYLDAKQRLVLR